MKFKFSFFLIFICLLGIIQSLKEKGLDEIQLLENKFDPRDDPKFYNNNKLDPVEESDLKTKMSFETNISVPQLIGDIYWEGWIKYFHYVKEEGPNQPKSFYENPDYFKQLVKQRRYNLKDEKGHRIHIPTKNHFWAVLLSNDNFNILGSRNKSNSSEAKTIDNLNTDLINHIIEDNNAGGAVRDIGKFNEGFCIKVSTKVPPTGKNSKYNPRIDHGDKERWIFCTDTEIQKNKLMKYLIAVKLRRQKEIGDVMEDPQPPEPKTGAEIVSSTYRGPVIVKYRGRDASEDDGYWILLQDWSPCSVKCGGGVQLQQWMCVPPKNKGHPCIGQSIRQRVCNEEDCPNTELEAPLLKTTKNSVMLKPIYKALPYSSRPQQYIKCMIKENDVLYKTKEYDPEKKIYSKVPGRIVMNTQTISVYKDDSFEHSLFNFNLHDTTLQISATDKCCFYLINANRQHEVCSMGSDCGSTNNPKWVNEWFTDFDYFKQKCYIELQQNNIQLNINNVNPLLANKNQPGNMLAVKLNIKGQYEHVLSPTQKKLVNERRNIIEKSIDSKQGTELDKKIAQTQKITLTALRREINFEDLIKNEEIQKGKEENAELKQQVFQEKKKKKLLEQALQARENNFSKLRKSKVTMTQIENIKKEAKIDIKFKRAVLKKKLEAIKNRYKRKNRMLQQQVQLIRSEMAQEIMEANKKGSINKCKLSRSNLVEIKTYCDSAFSDDFTKNATCKEPDSFCYTCCEHEFGGMFMNDRENCESMCDKLDEEDTSEGDWIWQNN